MCVLTRICAKNSFWAFFFCSEGCTFSLYYLWITIVKYISFSFTQIPNVVKTSGDFQFKQSVWVNWKCFCVRSHSLEIEFVICFSRATECEIRWYDNDNDNDNHGEWENAQNLINKISLTIGNDVTFIAGQFARCLVGAGCFRNGFLRNQELNVIGEFDFFFTWFQWNDCVRMWPF